MKKHLAAIFTVLLAFTFTACDDTKSYADLLGEEDYYVNNFLADNNVVLDIPADSISFITGPDAPFYRLDEDGLLYMRVLDKGTEEAGKVESNSLVYFRYMRYPLSQYKNKELPVGEGNDVTLNPTWFRYENFGIQSSYTWGAGIQRPLAFLPIDCHVQLVVKAQMGPTDEQTEVIPYLWDLTYQYPQ